MSEVQFMADLGSVVLRGAWPSVVGAVALDGCGRCRKMLDCRRAVEVSTKVTLMDGGPQETEVAKMYCDECYDGHISDWVDSGKFRTAVAFNFGMPQWAPPPDPTTLPLPGVMSDEHPEGSIRVCVQVTDGRKVMGPEEEDNELVPLPSGQEYVEWRGERFPVPTMGELESWVFDGNCDALDGCIVESDGRCPHGAPSWLIALGMV